MRALLLGASFVALFALVLNALAQEKVLRADANPPVWQDAATAVPCPPNVKACKVIVLTPDEEATLIGPDMIFDHAVWASRVKFDSLARAWREKLATAPAGKVVEAKPDASGNSVSKEPPKK